MGTCTRTKNLIVGLIVLLLLVGTVNAVCDSWIDKCERQVNDYNEGGSGTEASEILNAYWETARCYKFAGDNEKAIEMCGEAKKWGLKSVVECNNIESVDECIAESYGMIAGCYRDIKEYENSCNYCKKADEYFQKAEVRELDCDVVYKCNILGSNVSNGGSGGESDESKGAGSNEIHPDNEIPNINPSLELQKGVNDTKSRDNESLAGGTSAKSGETLEDSEFPFIPIVAAIILLASLAVFLIRKRK